MAKAKDEGNFLYVRSARGDDRVALHEIDVAHPGGSVVVAGDRVVKVGNTAMVQDALRRDQLTEDGIDADGRKAADEFADRMVHGRPAPVAVAVNPAALPTVGEVQAQGDYQKLSQQVTRLDLEHKALLQEVRDQQEKNRQEQQEALAKETEAIRDAKKGTAPAPAVVAAPQS
jgi:hypothetical protein